MIYPILCSCWPTTCALIISEFGDSICRTNVYEHQSPTELIHLILLLSQYPLVRLYINSTLIFWFNCRSFYDMKTNRKHQVFNNTSLASLFIARTIQTTDRQLWQNIPCKCNSCSNSLVVLLHFSTSSINRKFTLLTAQGVSLLVVVT